MADTSEHSDLSIESLPDLRDTILIVAWEGWNDAGESASTAAHFLARQLGGSPFASIDPEEFYDFTEARPMARYRDGERVIVWPGTDFIHLRGAADLGGRDIVVGFGIEPHYRWKRYLRAMTELVEAIDAKLVISLGAVNSGTPHTQPVAVSGSANSPALAERYNMRPSRFEGPSGIVGVFHDHCRRNNIGGVSLWAAVPHYLPGITNPVGAHALLRAVADMIEIPVDLDPLDDAIGHFHQQLDEALQENDELRDYVERLERAAPPPEQAGESELPSADELIEGLENFLRQRQDSDN